MSAATRADRWTDTAACVGRHDLDTATARRLCATCPHTGIHGPCYAEWRSMGDHERSANVLMWAGLTSEQLLATAPGLRVVDDSGLTRAQRRTLEVIERLAPVTNTQLSRMLNQSGTTTGRALQHLVEIGLIERRPGVPRPGPSFAPATYHIVAGVVPYDERAPAPASTGPERAHQTFYGKAQMR